MSELPATIDKPESQRSLVFGASGYIGSNLVPYLLKRDVAVRAVSRNRAVLEARNWPDAEILEADALDPPSLATALDNVDIAYYLVHSMAAGHDFGRLDLEAAANFARAAADAGIRMIVYLGGLVPADADSEHIRSRRDTGEVLRAGSVPVIEIRAGIIVGPGSAAFEVMRDLVYHLPMMVTPRWVRAKSPPIALCNLLEYLYRLPTHADAVGGIYDSAGPETLDYQQMMCTLAEVAGRRKPLIVPVAILSPRLSSYWLRFVTSVPTPIAQALIGGLKHDFSADTSAIERLVPQKLLNFRESVEAAFEAERSASVEARWVEGAFSMRNERPDYAFYAKRASGSASIAASPASVWQIVCAIGGQNRYYYLNSLWTLREVLDWMVGGQGLNRGRRHPQELRLGDRVDSWKVIGLEHERRLTMSFGMRAPGAGVLEFELTPLNNGRRTRLTATAYWHPAGVGGLLYWYSLAPAHRVIFDGLTREIGNRARQLQRMAKR
jgi:uncharacterized protein YbjT (DUF2867 family)